MQILQRVRGLLQSGDPVAALSLAKSEVMSLRADEAATMCKLIAAISLFVGESREVEHLIDEDDESVNALLVRARAAINLDDLEAAWSLCVRAKELYPEHDDVLLMICEGVRVANSSGRRFGNCDASVGFHARLSDEHRAALVTSFELLRQGNLEAGFTQRYNDWGKFGCTDIHFLGHTIPQWKGQHIGRLLLYANDGIGDVLMFARYMAAARLRCNHLTIATHSTLISFLSNNLTADLIIPYENAITALATAEAYTQMSDLPAVLEIFEHGGVPYLTAEPAFTSKEGRLQIGLCWASSPHGAEEGRTAGLAEFQPFAGVEGIDWHSLVPGAGSDWMQIYHPADYEETARVVVALDLVITVDTGVAHLAGAMGKPVWILLPEKPCWRWETHPTKSAWYSTATLFRKRIGEPWSSLVDRALVQLRMGVLK